ncbi:MAG TPA: aminoacyl-histidine dipeptidase [Bacteroidales bacterium]|jgi:dipeptidase D|nr:aminoacyl-histidine dipeptidase [Bacteroidales bacterium]MDD4375147.1 aminoacyl-histidine dipeptidase [Bacteroidales bacterium]MDY0084747.1 aminoacyl-histidine dipeptidase [Bacteroidales bacterium]HOI31761.1 aminoacyl-histidine dipeptidase [Bacteroidales bacterium]HPE42877.1 aminoacyl-histidine dipeptidase [Bacteroidales bacterium]
MSSILDLEPKGIWKNFYSLTQIPRPSKKEEKIIAFTKEFCEKLGLETIVDEVGNVIARKPATPGMEDRKGIILQAHLDMVPQKNEGTDHDFEKDPIETYIEDGWVKAKGTTLGSDNGIGAAAAMTVLEATDLEHGPIEALFTIDEETGMTGANELKPGILKGDILLNMDSEDEGELYIGCAGGVDSTGEFKFKLEATPADHKAYRIVVKGLKGGHSGLDIHLGRGNANKIINTLMLMAADKVGLRVSQVDGGSLRNAIPREAFATIVVPAKNAELFEQFTAEFEAIAKDEFAEADGGLSIQAEAAELPENVVDMKTQNSLFEAVAKCPNGVIAMSKDMEGVVETSTNLATVKMNDGQFVIGTLQRSSVDADKEKLAAQIRDVFEKAGGKAYSSGDYPGWKPNVKSPILHAMKDVYNNKFGKVPEVKVIHAGLECGILGSAYPNWDMISFGPTIRHPHSPDEKVNIDTVKLFWEYLVETLKHAPKK